MDKKKGNYWDLVTTIQRHAKEEELEAKDVIMACEIVKSAVINGIIEGVI